MTVTIENTAAVILAELNAMREIVGKAPMKHPTSKAAMMNEIHQIEADQEKLVKQAKKAAKKAAAPKGESNEKFTLAEVARACGVNPKVARARYRKQDNDGVRTYYEFTRTTEEWARVEAIILPKK